MKKRKITKTKTIDGSMWYYLAEADEKEERESPPLSVFERNAILQSLNIIKSDIADELTHEDKDFGL